MHDPFEPAFGRPLYKQKEVSDFPKVLAFSLKVQIRC
jgi:hypothetical protein